jgi:hypothetical protein
MVNEFPAGSIKHVHGVYTDPYSDRLWIPTGDFAGECYLYSTDEEFRELMAHGDGQQSWWFGKFHAPCLAGCSPTSKALPSKPLRASPKITNSSAVCGPAANATTPNLK